jgi:hypothetical protein
VVGGQQVIVSTTGNPTPYIISVNEGSGAALYAQFQAALDACLCNC